MNFAHDDLGLNSTINCVDIYIFFLISLCFICYFRSNCNYLILYTYIVAWISYCNVRVVISIHNNPLFMHDMKNLSLGLG